MQDVGDDLPVVLALRSGLILGMNGAITAHCSSESQNRSAIAASMLQTAALNHKTLSYATPWFGSHHGTLDQAVASRSARLKIPVRSQRRQ